MIKTYILPVNRIDNTETMDGIEYATGGLVNGCIEPDRKALIKDVTLEEDKALSALAISSKDSTPKEIGALQQAQSVTPKGTGRDLYAEVDNLKTRLETLEKG